MPTHQPANTYICMCTYVPLHTHVYMSVIIFIFIIIREEQVTKLQESTRDIFDHCFQVNQGIIHPCVYMHLFNRCMYNIVLYISVQVCTCNFVVFH